MGVELEVYVGVVTDKADRNWADTKISEDRAVVDEWMKDQILGILGSGTLRLDATEHGKILRLANSGVLGAAIDKFHMAQERYSCIIDTAVQMNVDPSGKIARHMAADGLYKVLGRLIGETSAGLLEDRDDVKLRMDILLAITAWEKAR